MIHHVGKLDKNINHEKSNGHEKRNYRCLSFIKLHVRILWRLNLRATRVFVQSLTLEPHKLIEVRKQARRSCWNVCKLTVGILRWVQCSFLDPVVNGCTRLRWVWFFLAQELLIDQTRLFSGPIQLFQYSFFFFDLFKICGRQKGGRKSVESVLSLVASLRPVRPRFKPAFPLNRKFIGK